MFVTRDRRLTFALTAALAASLAAITWSILLHQSHTAGHPPNVRPRFVNGPVDWRSRVISQAMANGADFRGADLDNASLNGLQLSHMNLDGVRADRASFRGAQLEDASLRGASLRGACLAGADLTGADLTGADFTGADVAGVRVSSQATQTALAWPGTVSVAASTVCREADLGPGPPRSVSAVGR